MDSVTDSASLASPLGPERKSEAQWKSDKQAARSRVEVSRNLKQLKTVNLVTNLHSWRSSTRSADSASLASPLVPERKSEVQWKPDNSPLKAEWKSEEVQWTVKA